MQQEITNWLEEHIPSWINSRYLLAVSGGMDSMVLAHLFQSLGLSYKIAHCNFQLRGEESDADEEFVHQYSTKAEIDFLVKRFNTAEFGTKNKLSTQEAARELRYQWFEELRTDHNLDYVVVGTHKSDEVETILINLLRGGGMRGAHGILPVRDCIIRPMLNHERGAIYEYASRQEIDWREDSSNLSDNYLRNKLRHQVIPVLKGIRPNVEKQISKSARNIRDYENIVNNEIERVRSKLVTEDQGVVKINKTELEKLNPSYIYLYELIRNFGFSYIVCEDVVASLNKQAGGLYYSGTHTLVNDRENLLIIPTKVEQLESIEISDKIASTEFPLALSFVKVNADNYQLERNSELAELDYHKLSFPLILRPWKNGDRFQPLGMTGFKKVSDFLVDEKVPRTLKDSIYVLESAGEIVWLVGMRIDNRFKLTEKSSEVYRISLT